MSARAVEQSNKCDMPDEFHFAKKERIEDAWKVDCAVGARIGGGACGLQASNDKHDEQLACSRYHRPERPQKPNSAQAQLPGLPSELLRDHVGIVPTVGVWRRAFGRAHRPLRPARPLPDVHSAAQSLSPALAACPLALRPCRTRGSRLPPAFALLFPASNMTRPSVSFAATEGLRSV